MALTSPGVQVSVIDESFYTPAEPGTTPMVFVVSAQDKKNAAGTGTATGTTKANAGKPFLLTSQRDLADTFGDPVFETDASNNAVHAGELNEYGLQAAYSYLGISNAAFVTRADVDTNQLKPKATAPAAYPTNGTYWFDTSITTFGLQEWNGAAVTVTGGQSFTNRVPSVITDVTFVTGTAEAPGAPKTSFGTIGDYAVVALTTLNTMWYKTAGNAPGVTAGTWVQLGSEDWMKSWPTVQGSKANPSFPGSTSITVNGVSISVTSVDTVTTIASTINGLSISGVLAAAVNSKLEIYSDGNSSGAADSTFGGPIVIGGDSATLTLLGIDAGNYFPPALQISAHTSVPEWKTADTYTRPTGSIWFKTTQANLGARFRVKSFNSATLLWETIEAPLYASNEEALYKLDLAGGGANLAAGALYVQTNCAGDAQPLGSYKIYRREAATPTSVRGSKIVASTMTAGVKTFTVASTDAGKATFNTPITVSATFNGTITDADTLAAAITSANIENVTADVDSQNRVTISHSQFGDIRFVDTDGSLTEAGFTAYVSTTSGTPNLYYVAGTDGTTNPKQLQASQWKPLAYTASPNEVTALTDQGTLWYSSVVDEVDLMIHNGTTWVGYLDSTSPYYNASEGEQTDPAGPIVSASSPTLQSDGTALKNGDVWISTAVLSSYPQIYVFNANKLNTPIANRWELRDSADQTTENGVLFADARYATAGSLSTASAIEDLLVSNFLDTDAPDPALYPKGMLLYNLRRSGFNVKRFERNWVNVNGDNLRFNNNEAMENYYPHRWVTESGNQADGSGSFGAKAQRKVVVQALQSLVNSNSDIRDDESRLFNLMATPGYPELIGEMISLNYDRGLSAFIIGDAPFTLKSNATDLNNWATNQALAPEDNDDGLVSRDEYLGVFYPAGFSSDNAGNNIVVPPSHMMLRTMALSDQVSFPWFAPAGIRRGGITNATSTGFVDAEGEFNVVSLNEGQRDTLYAQNVNPITFITGAGLVAYGQKTRARGTSALDRINVARLVIYLRSQLQKLAKPYIFEPNDKITRDEIKGAAESLLLELVGQRALYDFLVVCDESNNTPSRIDRNELYLDIAIEPVKAVEFIYIPLRLKNTGEIAGL